MDTVLTCYIFNNVFYCISDASPPFKTIKPADFQITPTATPLLKNEKTPITSSFGKTASQINCRLNQPAIRYPQINSEFDIRNS